MDSFANMTSTFSRAKEQYGISLGEMADILDDFRAKYGPAYTHCLMCETLHNRLKQWWTEAAEADPDPFGAGLDFFFDMGLTIQRVRDETALLLPGLGLENVLLGTEQQVYELMAYIRLLRRRPGNVL